VLQIITDPLCVMLFNSTLEIMIRLILITLLIFFSEGALAASPKITGIFSSMRFGTEDVSGVEVIISYSDRGYFAQVQCAEGAISRPVLVPVIVAATFIEFIVPVKAEPNSYSCPQGKFKGEISNKGMSGHFEGTKWPGFLKRSGSFWHERSGT
jgi:hypothetical protein